jgi:hypothetical protein
MDGIEADRMNFTVIVASTPPAMPPASNERAGDICFFF